MICSIHVNCTAGHQIESELQSHRIRLYYSNQCIKIKAISFGNDVLLMMIGLNTDVCFYLFDDLHPNFVFHRKWHLPNALCIASAHACTYAVTAYKQSNRIYDTNIYRQLTCFSIATNNRIYKFRYSVKWSFSTAFVTRLQHVCVCMQYIQLFAQLSYRISIFMQFSYTELRAPCQPIWNKTKTVLRSKEKLSFRQFRK